MKRIGLLVICMLVLAVGSASADTITIDGVPTFTPASTWSLIGGTLTITNPVTLTFGPGGFDLGGNSTISANFIGAVGNQYNFSGGTLTVNCTAIVNCVAATIGAFSINQGNGSAAFSNVALTAVVDPSLLPLLGILNGETNFFGTFGGSLNGTLGTGGEYQSSRGTPAGYDATLNQVPEPASMFLLGTGLVGAGRLIRKKLLVA